LFVAEVPLVLSENNEIAETALHATLPVYVSQRILWKYEAIMGQTPSALDQKIIQADWLNIWRGASQIM
jgi:hypothetical protein